MKSISMIGMALSVGLSAALGGAPAAYAGVNNHPGSICQPDVPSEAVNLNYENSGVINNGPSAMNVVCPLVRTNTTSEGATVWVDVNHLVNATTSCSVASFDYTGTFLGSAVGTFSGAGFKEIRLDINGAGKSSYWSRYTVKCTIAGNKVVSILGVIISE